MKKIIFFSGLLAFFNLTVPGHINGQWAANGNHIYNANSGYVGIGMNTPGGLLYVSKLMTEPAISVRNTGGTGGATYVMMDDASGANWKFKATLSGGFKIRDHAFGLDVIVIEPNGFPNALYIDNNGSIGINNTAPDNSALVDMNSNSMGFQPPRLTQVQISSISNPADGLLAYCTTDEKFYMYSSSATLWKDIQYGTGIITPTPPACGFTLNISHVTGSVAPVNKTTSYGTVTNVPGETAKCWITSNLGSDQQATTVNDATEASAGWYWQFNRQQGFKHDGITRTPNTSWITGITENSSWLSANDPCAIELGGTWRIPAYSEWNNVMSAGSWYDWNGPWNSLLKMHAAGYLDNTGALVWRGSDGAYWSDTQYDNSYGWSPYFYSSSCYMGSSDKAYGLAIRCIQ